MKVFLIILALGCFGFIAQVVAQSVQTGQGLACTKVGNAPEDQMPIECKRQLALPSPTSSGRINDATCPLRGKRVIGCGSFMSDSKYNRGSCAGLEPINRGHCGTNYGCYAGSIPATRNMRRAHSIDVDAPTGELVYLPTINGQELDWEYQPGMSYGVAPGDGGGYGHVFTAQTGADRWVLHLLHMNPPPITPLTGGGSYRSGDPVTTVAQTDYPHLHINIGLNPGGANGGSGWLDPESLGMCTD